MHSAHRTHAIVHQIIGIRLGNCKIGIGQSIIHFDCRLFFFLVFFFRVRSIVGCVVFENIFVQFRNRARLHISTLLSLFVLSSFVVVEFSFLYLFCCCYFIIFYSSFLSVCKHHEMHVNGRLSWHIYEHKLIIN